MKKDYTIAVAGTGYVGLSIATLLSQHHKVMAVDIVKEKVDLINYNSDYNVNKKYRISNNVRAKYFKWYVKNKSIVSVNKYGIAVAKKVGSTKVSCRYMTEDGTWRMSKSATVVVKDVGDVKISYTTSSSTGDKNTFDTITCTVKNNSNSAIEFDRHVYVDDGTGWRFTNDTNLYHYNQVKMQLSFIKQLIHTISLVESIFTTVNHLRIVILGLLNLDTSYMENGFHLYITFVVVNTGQQIKIIIIKNPECKSSGFFYV